MFTNESGSETSNGFSKEICEQGTQSENANESETGEEEICSCLFSATSNEIFHVESESENVFWATSTESEIFLVCHRCAHS